MVTATKDAKPRSRDLDPAAGRYALAPVNGSASPRLYVQGGTNLSDRNREGDLFVQGGVGVDLWFAEQD